MSTTFSAPLKVFKRNNPTNTGVIAADNSGAVMASQQFTVSPVLTTSAVQTLTLTPIGTTNTTTTMTLPAGSIISNVSLYENAAPSALTGGVITPILTQTSSIGTLTTTAVGTITPTTSGGVIPITFATNTSAANVLANVGTTDITLSFSAAAISAITGTLGGVLYVEYTARNINGSIIPTGQGYTNS